MSKRDLLQPKVAPFYRKLALEYKDLIALNKYQANVIMEMRDEIIRLKIERSSDASQL